MNENIPSFKQGEQIDTKIAHWTMFAPGRSGMYETIKEMVKYENRIPGVLAGIVEPLDRDDCKKGGKIDPIEDTVVTQSWNWALQDATVHMIHFTQMPLIGRLKPKVFVLHGSLEASLYSELDPSQHKFSSLSTGIDLLNSCDATIAIHKRQYQQFKQFDHNNKLSYIRRGVDLERWKPEGAKMALDGKPAVLYSEVWRHMKDPLLSLYAMHQYGTQVNMEAKYHLIGCTDYYDTWQQLIYNGRFHEVMGKYGLGGHQMFPEHWMRGADMTISPVMSGEDSRVAIESLACGTPVVAWDTDMDKSGNFVDYIPTAAARAFNTSDMADKIHELWLKLKDHRQEIRAACRGYAVENFDMNYTAQLLVNVCRQVQGN